MRKSIIGVVAALSLVGLQSVALADDTVPAGTVPDEKVFLGLSAHEAALVAGGVFTAAAIGIAVSTNNNNNNSVTAGTGTGGTGTGT